MTERTRQEIDNQMNNINEYSEEINDDYEGTEEYPIDEYRSVPDYQKSYHTQNPYSFEDEYTEKNTWEESLDRYGEYRPDDYNREGWQWNEREREETPVAWPTIEKKSKKEKSAPRKKSKFRVCTNCGTTTTPAWRRSTSNKILLCNACGLYQRLHGSNRPFSVTPDGKTKAIKNNIEKGICRGCGVVQTPLWKRGNSNEWLCSSCGLLYSRREREREEYGQEWSEYSQSEAWKYTEEYPEGTRWHEKEAGQDQAIQYEYMDKDAEANYFGDDRFRGYFGYYDQEKE
ncbi:hypothetical protein NEAUS04_0088 [Nematocida ausubeli]|uniref:GATA-type domain-containing protein n=1 Tax=Nematocida ausubeli (strain ATCC PRA-371 / ERTm2) TaxID=1913371 RepID=A0A086J074_NEMA1|nr:uncharacterized protein NESG_02321 [Nematocida ausubeli]KAI5134451.1 hypothetical protein NEAUS06_1091 [Nematocida ausubeli]KAI5136356.1 hypothetical protein NEAUS07_1600 [Nematocida ausubeli]KAI5149573.1 hypothetical protein NEAUS05_1819 [Nematocida ausubeli]KAI5160691.1 hypothetical protein NEAUS04_0088 [Nematocida ausubeli]KFG25542.1 hypothetical protein NESG_02321 [Nematocida ausubeli]